MEEAEIELKLHQLNEQEAQLLYWVYQDLQYGAIYGKMKIGEERQTQIMKGVYKKLGIDPKLHWTVKRDELEPFKTIFLKEYKLGKKWPPDTGNTQPIKVPVKRTPLILYILLVAVFVVIMVATGIIGYGLGKNTPPQQVTILVTAADKPTIQSTKVPTTTNIPMAVVPTNAPTPTIQPTYTPYPTYTIPPTKSGPTDTLEPTQIVYSSPDEGVTLKENVYLTLRPTIKGYWNCQPETSTFWIFVFNLQNNSGSEFLVRFTPDTFTIVDNNGKNYPSYKSGVGGCDPGPGVRTEDIGSNGSDYVSVAFRATLGLDVKYFIITIKNISGFGPFSFRYDL
jgi:hypothetical protein